MRFPCLKKLIWPLFSLATIPAFGSPTYLGLYMQSQKIGFASYKTSSVSKGGRQLTESDTHTMMDTGLLGSPLHIEIDSQSFSTGDLPVEMDFQMKSAGRTQSVVAKFSASDVALTVNNSGTVTNRSIKRPSGAIVDDPLNLVLQHMETTMCFVLDPTTVSFVQNTVKLIGTKNVEINGKQVKETIVDVIDPRGTTRTYLDDKGDLIRAEAPMGLTMVPETQAVAMAKPKAYSKDVDLAYSSSIVPSGTLEDPAATRSLLLEFIGKDLSQTPSDEVQTVKGSGEKWTVSVHPPRITEGEAISVAAKEKPEWIKPDLDIPSDQPKFKALARQIIEGKTRSTDAAMAVKDWVYSQMKPNAGIGVLRDATEVLQSKEGVCRDYAILTATLLRSAGIPTRLASGLVNWDGTFYYHAWDEIWDGQHWIGIDSTSPDKQISAAHVKLAQGSVADAFTFAVLDHVKVKVLSSQR